MPTDVQRIQALFLAAAEISIPADRARFLDGACDGDAEVRSRVEVLLRAHDQPDSLLDHPAVAAPNPAPEATQALTGTPEPGVAVSQTAGGVNGASDDEALTFLAPPTRPDSLGRIGHYEVLQVLGRGGFGIVFRAFDELLQRVVALKVMAPQLAATSPARKRFLREARSSAQVRHENVVQVYEVAEQPLPYLAMEFIPGETLQQRLDRLGPVEPAEVVRVGRQIAEGLAAAHVNDLIHRDIKPGNILLEAGQLRAKITDFGLARAADDASISASGIIAGTPMYMAPEQAKGEKIDHRADLFSLGSVLYQMASGRPPFRANGTLAVLKRVADDTPRDIREIIPETPQWLCDIIAKLHAKDPDERYQSAREVADVLADCEAQLKANARLKDFSRIPHGKPAARVGGRWKWAVAATLLLPVLGLVLTEITGATHLLRGEGPTHDPLQGVNRPGDNGPPPNQQPTAAPLKHGATEYTNTLGMKFKLIPAGKFTMGSPREEIDRCCKLEEARNDWAGRYLRSEGPDHPVEITRSFYLGVTEVTVGQFRQFVEEAKYQVGDTHWRDPGFEQTDDHPVVCVSCKNAIDFCAWLSKKEGKTYRLPTEAEWEYSCRAGKPDSRYCFGNDEAQLQNYATYNNDRNGTSPVGQKKPNDWGLYDMHGNAWEWCQDYWAPDYYLNSPVKDPMGPGAGEGFVCRGGSWRDAAVYCRSAFRVYAHAPDSRDTNNRIGFRVLLVAPTGSVRPESGAKD